jgi:SNF2 family DNA or RNA helicase
MWSNVPWEAEAWNGKLWKMVPKVGSKLQVWTTNVDSIKSERSRALLQPFVRVHGRHGLMIAVDESQDIKNHSAKRSKLICELGARVNQRAIMTGTPIAKDLTDEWSQFKFLDERIIGHRYKTAFMAQFCIMGGFDGHAVVGHRNVEHFNSLVDPHIFRVTKAEELELPPKVYDHVVFDLSDEQKHHMRELRESFLTRLDSGEISSVTHAASMLVRVQQLTCGYLVDDNDHHVMLKDNPRLHALTNLIDQRTGKIIIWCRFNKDIETLAQHFGNQCVTYYGATSTRDRETAKRQFLSKDPIFSFYNGNPGIRFFIANPGAAGVGLNLQGECRTAIYYSNSFNALERWQSEDRIHRIGTTGAVTYFDLIARGSFDRKILANLRAKKSLSDWVLDDIRRMISESLTT